VSAIPFRFQRITRRQGRGDEAYCTYVEEADDDANKVSQRKQIGINQLLTDISNVIFPPRCLACAEIFAEPQKQVFCRSCHEKIRYMTGSHCPVCGITYPDSPAQNHICGNCLEDKPYYSCARAVASFETILMEAIHQFKYGRNIFAGDALASFMADFSYPDFEFAEYSLFIPVPLHVKKLRERGFNQSLILANALSKKHEIPVNFSLLKRHKFTLTQTGLNKAEREKNIKGAFIVTDPEKIAGKSVILIDDVYTTGSTLNECAKTLIKARAEKVAVLTLTRVIANPTRL
jgi:ComF family protein